MGGVLRRYLGEGLVEVEELAEGLDGPDDPRAHVKGALRHGAGVGRDPGEALLHRVLHLHVDRHHLRRRDLLRVGALEVLADAVEEELELRLLVRTWYMWSISFRK